MSSPKVAESAEFKKAAEEVKNLASKPNNEQMLELYGLYKFGRGEQAKEASFYDLKGKEMYKAWKKVDDSKIKPEEAQKKYVEVVERLKNEIGTK